MRLQEKMVEVMFGMSVKGYELSRSPISTISILW
jgi:hypothetical protein